MRSPTRRLNRSFLPFAPRRGRSAYIIIILVLSSRPFVYKHIPNTTVVPLPTLWSLCHTSLHTVSTELYQHLTSTSGLTLPLHASSSNCASLFIKQVTGTNMVFYHVDTCLRMIVVVPPFLCYYP